MDTDTLTCPAETSEEVLALLREQDLRYAELESHASRQSSLVANEDPGPLLALLTERQRLSAALTRIAAKLEPIRRNWAFHRAEFSPPQRAEADRLLTAVKERLRRVIARDEEDARLLSARKQAAAEALRVTHTTSEALSAYRTPADRPGRLDRLDEAS